MYRSKRDRRLFKDFSTIVRKHNASFEFLFSYKGEEGKVGSLYSCYVRLLKKKRKKRKEE